MDKREFSARRRIWGGTMRGLMLLCAAVTCALAVFLIVYVLVKGVPNLSWQLLSTMHGVIRLESGYVFEDGLAYKAAESGTYCIHSIE